MPRSRRAAIVLLCSMTVGCAADPREVALGAVLATDVPTKDDAHDPSPRRSNDGNGEQSGARSDDGSDGRGRGEGGGAGSAPGADAGRDHGGEWRAQPVRADVTRRFSST